MAVFEPPKHVFSVAGGRYWYFQRDRWKPKDERGPLIRLPEPNTAEWFAKLAELGALPKGPKAVAGTVAALWLTYQQGSTWPKAEGSQKAYESHWRNHIEPIIGDMEVAKVTTRMVLDLRDSLVDMPTTTRTVLSILKSMFKIAVDKRMRDDNPAAGIDRPKVDPDGAKPLTPEAWAALMAPECPPVIYRLAILGRGTGQRISDLIQMTPEMREDDGIVHPIKKTSSRTGNAPHYSPIEEPYRSTIDGWKHWRTRPYLDMRSATSKASKPTEQILRNAWNAYAAKEAGAALRGFTPHDLRATAMCDELLEGFTAAEIAKRRGCVMQIVERYTKHLEKKLTAIRSGQRVKALKGQNGTG